MRVLHLSTARSWRGGEQQLAYLFDSLQGFPAKQWIACPSGSALASYTAEQDIPHFIFKKRIPADPLAALHLARFCRKADIQLLHAHDSHAHTLACLGALWSKSFPPFLVSRRVAFPIGKSALSRWKYRHPKLQRIVCVSEAVRRQLLQDGLAKGRLQVVYSTIDTQRFAAGPDGRLRQQLQLPEDQPLIGGIGAIDKDKDFFTFVRAAEQLLKKHSAHFVIIGADGGAQREVEQLIRQKNLTAHITLTGFRTDIPRILPELDAFLFTTRFEGLGTSVLDAFAAGVPVVASRTGGIPEMVEHEQTGLLAEVGHPSDFARQLLRMLESPALATRLTQQARHRLQQQFSPSEMGVKTWTIYQKVLGSPA